VHPESAIRAVPGKGEQFCAVWGGHFVWEVLMVAFLLREAKVVCLFFFSVGNVEFRYLFFFGVEC
jgi:hypothetical protein